jgi:hypothetical protein
MSEALHAGAIARYDRLLAQRHLDSTVDGLAQAHRRRGMFHPDGRRWCTVLRPCLVDLAFHERAQRAALLVARAVTEVTERVLADRRLRAAIGMPPYLDAALEIDREGGNASLLARLDGFVDGEEIRFIEYNAEPGGMASAKEVDCAFAALPIARELAAVEPFASFDPVELAVDALLRDAARAGRPGPPAIAMLRVATSMVQSAKLRWLPYAASRGCRVFVVRPEECDVGDSGVTVEGVAIDLLAIADWGAVFAPSEAMRRLLRCAARGDVRTLNGISRVVAGTSKVLFEILTSRAYAHFFDNEVAQALARHVPWTRWVRDATTDLGGREVDLMRYIEDRREELVLKPGNDKGGEGVVIGMQCDDAAWRDALARAQRRPTVVQQRIALPRQSFPVVGDDGALAYDDLIWDYNPYVWNGDVAAGALVRASRSPNLSAGTGSVTPLWVVG